MLDSGIPVRLAANATIASPVGRFKKSKSASTYASFTPPDSSTMALNVNGSLTPSDGRGVKFPAIGVPTGGVMSTSAAPTSNCFVIKLLLAKSVWLIDYYTHEMSLAH